MTVLVFPSSLEASPRLAEAERSRGRRVVGASSLAHDPYAGRFDDWARLPFIGEPGFYPALAELAQRLGITEVMSPHSATFHFLEQSLAAAIPHLKLVGEAPHATQMRAVAAALAEAPEQAARAARYAGRDDAPPATLVAAILLQADRIYGECAREKILALCGALADAPKGDVVEIGAFFGKSAYVLNRLAAHFGLGLTLVVDPWRLDDTIQADSPRHIQDLARAWDWETVFQGFLLNMQGCAVAPFNYLRLASEAAFAHYASGRPVETAAFGATTPEGRIAVLHIDGNHDEACVARDFELWSPRLAAGGWIVFDDYDWPHGDGPRRVADRAEASWGARVARRFTAGGALFLKIA